MARFGGYEAESAEKTADAKPAEKTKPVAHAESPAPMAIDPIETKELTAEGAGKAKLLYEQFVKLSQEIDGIRRDDGGESISKAKTKFYESYTALKSAVEKNSVYQLKK